MPPNALFRELADIVSNLQVLHDELAFAKQQQLEAEVNAWMNSKETSVEGRKREARYASSTATAQILDLEGKIAVTTEEKFFIILLINNDKSLR